MEEGPLLGSGAARRVWVVEPFGRPWSAEFDYLWRLRRQEVERAFGEARFVTGLSGTEIGDEDLVLEVGSDRVLVLRGTLRAMLEAVIDGASCACPFTLAEVNAEPPVFSLRGFEEEEAKWIARPRKEEARNGQRAAPLRLWRGEAWRRRNGEEPIRQVRVGLAHEFIDYYGETREDVLPFVPPEAREVLEIGCARGLTGALLQERLGCRVTGVELNPEVAAEASRRLWKVIGGDVEQVPIEGTYDAIVALELFEHLRDPFGFLERARGWLRPGGVLILSTPNVGHWSVVWDLLHGRWDYLPIGLLCFTHLRFFTRESLERLLRLAGWDDVAVYPQRSGVPRQVSRGLRKVRGVDWESLGTAGFWVVARKTHS